ncbi:MAG: VIT1/CCC1 transporter family protein, partial [candidate division NC10 bacterium]|nr:VIT1/CCC1 transporter family protein [candidate division NC10 bacterium]
MDEFDPRLHFTTEETWHSPGGKAIREVVFGMHDGLITSLGFLSGVSGAQAGRDFILLAGLASAFAQTLSMGFGAYLSTKSEREFYQREIDRERYEIDHLPEKEREELRVIYRQKGFREDEVEMIVKHLTSDKELWLKTMMV